MKTALGYKGAFDYVAVWGVIALLTFCLGLFLGGKIYACKQRAFEQRMEETRKELKQHPSSVILIEGDIADAAGFKLRKYDLDMRKENAECRMQNDNRISYRVFHRRNTRHFGNGIACCRQGRR